MIKKIIERLKKTSDNNKALLAEIEVILGKEARKKVEKQLRDNNNIIRKKDVNTPKGTVTYLEVKGLSKEENNKLKTSVLTKAFQTIAEEGFELITQQIAPHIVGHTAIKQAVALQLLTTERLHILLLGDPGTGKTDILRAAEELADKSAFGLGSGTSGAGLSITYSGDERQEGLLLKAHKGICLIDELNLMQKEDRAALYNAMEKGFITYDKGGRHEKHPADVRILATANPKKDRFEGSDIKALREQLPFSPALISRFHLVFLIRRPDTKEYVKIASSITKNTQVRTHPEFFREYIKYAKKISVKFPDKLEQQIIRAAEKIKEQEDNLLIEVSPRLIKGLIGFSQSSARSELRNEVEQKDIDRVLSIYSESLGIKL